MTRRPHSAAGLLALLLAACGSSSLVIGGDPEREPLSAATGSAGTAAGGSSSGGDSAAPTSSVAGSATGGTQAAGDVTNRYPWVVWAQGRGYEQACEPDGDVWGATCWHHGDAGTLACEPDGEPFCSACNCMVSCVTGSDCPTGSQGEPAECLARAGERGLCFLSCLEAGECPTGMTCSPHPELGRTVCMWVDRDWQAMPTPR